MRAQNIRGRTALTIPFFVGCLRPSLNPVVTPPETARAEIHALLYSFLEDCPANHAVSLYRCHNSGQPVVIQFFSNYSAENALGLESQHQNRRTLYIATEFGGDGSSPDEAIEELFKELHSHICAAHFSYISGHTPITLRTIATLSSSVGVFDVRFMSISPTFQIDNQHAGRRIDAHEVRSLMAASDIKKGVMRTILERNRRDDEQAFQDFCEELLSLPADLELVPRQNFKADIELQPLRWMTLAMDLLKSRRVTGYLQLQDGVQGPEINSYLPYPVFQAATEIFLKGMWLCQYADCRGLAESSYIEKNRRQNYSESLKELGHDLLAIVDNVRGIPEYQRTAAITRFLDLVERVVRLYYFPPYESDKHTRWADCRYAKRVYDDSAQKAAAESFQRYPRAVWVEKLFQQAERNVDGLWQLRTETERPDFLMNENLPSEKDLDPRDVWPFQQIQHETAEFEKILNKNGITIRPESP